MDLFELEEIKNFIKNEINYALSKERSRISRIIKETSIIRETEAGEYCSIPGGQDAHEMLIDIASRIED